MPNPFLNNVVFDVDKTVSVQNRVDENGTVATYILLKPGVASHFQIRKGNQDSFAELVFKIDRAVIPQLTASLGSALASPTVTGSW
jgi:hypothetical protein